MDWLFKLLPGVSSLGPWLSRKGGLGAVILGLIAAYSLITLECVPSIPDDPTKTNIQWWHIVCLVGVPSLFLIVWFTATQLYLRTGCRPKIGLAYDGHNVNIADWKRTQKTLRDLLANKRIKNRVTLRLVPARSVLTEDYANKYMKGYGFSILTIVQQSPTIPGASDGSTVSVPTLTVKVVTKATERRFLQTLLPHQFMIARKVDRNLGAILNAQAVNLHDLLLLVVAAHYYLEEKYNDAAVILKHLDQSLSSTIGPADVPRSQIRLLDMNARLHPAQFSVKEMPPYDTLVEILGFAESAMCYFNDYPLVAVVLSRMRFLTGDTEGAIKLTQLTKSKIDEIRESGLEPTPIVLVEYYLNSAFLSFIQGHWVNAYSAYDSMLRLDAYHNENWPEVIDFIDCVFDLERYEGVTYLRFLYRLIAKIPVAPELRNAAEDWVDQDPSREELKSLLARCYPTLHDQTQTKSTSIGDAVRRSKKTTKRSKKKTKERSKRKAKGRKKRKK